MIWRESRLFFWGRFGGSPILHVYGKDERSPLNTVIIHNWSNFPPKNQRNRSRGIANRNKNNANAIFFCVRRAIKNGHQFPEKLFLSLINDSPPFSFHADAKEDVPAQNVRDFVLGHEEVRVWWSGNHESSILSTKYIQTTCHNAQELQAVQVVNLINAGIIDEHVPVHYSFARKK